MSEQPEQLRILFDVGILGDAFQYSLSSTGIARVAENLLQALAQRSDVILCPVTFTGNDYSCRKFLERETDFKSLDLSFLRELGLQGRLTDLFYRLEFACRRAQSRANLPYKAFWGKTFKNLFKSLKQTLVRIDRRKHVLLHDQTWYYISIAGCPPDWLLKTKNVRAGLFIHDTIPLTHTQYCKDAKIPRDYQKRLQAAKDAKFVFCISQNTRNELLRAESEIKPSCTHVIPMAAKSHFRPPEKTVDKKRLVGAYGIPFDRPFALSVCTIEPRKNLSTLVQAYLLHLKENPESDLDLVLAGPTGWETDQFMHLLNATSLIDERIHLTGFVEEEDLPGLYASAEFFVYPSFYEGFGLPVIEAMQSKLPVICSNTSSLPEAGGSAGYYISPTDTPALALALTSMHHEPNLRQNYAEKSRAQAAKFSWNASASELIRVLHSDPAPMRNGET